ncbi:MAG: hypothetical protein JW731_02410 [Bacteroidales bacterium]|nr:hypothetical protein [Bacteroidales bacterium]
MEENVNIKKLAILLRVLLNDVQDFHRGSFFGVRSMDPEVLKLWEDYNFIRSLLVDDDHISEEDFPELPYPQPLFADAKSLYKEGTMIYRPEHFAPLRMNVERLLNALSFPSQKESA